MARKAAALGDRAAQCGSECVEFGRRYDQDEPGACLLAAGNRVHVDVVDVAAFHLQLFRAHVRRIKPLQIFSRHRRVDIALRDEVRKPMPPLPQGLGGVYPRELRQPALQGQTLLRRSVMKGRRRVIGDLNLCHGFLFTAYAT